jgi:hypothetical protein
MLRSLGCVLLLALMAGAAARADTEQARFAVTATIRERVAVAVATQPVRLSVSDADIRRGYKDISARYLVDSNAGRGYLLRLAPRLGLAERIEVAGLATPIVLRGDEVEIYRPQAAHERELVLDYRIVLAADVQPGSYELPVHVAASPF